MKLPSAYLPSRWMIRRLQFKVGLRLHRVPTIIFWGIIQGMLIHKANGYPTTHPPLTKKKLLSSFWRAHPQLACVILPSFLNSSLNKISTSKSWPNFSFIISTKIFWMLWQLNIHWLPQTQSTPSMKQFLMDSTRRGCVTFGDLVSCYQYRTYSLTNNKI